MFPDHFNFFRSLIFFLCLLPTFGQEKIKKTETISTPPKLLRSSIKIGDTQKIEVKVTSVFTLTAVTVEGTLTGNLVFIWTEEARQKIAEAISRAVAEIPPTVVVKDLSAKLKKNAHCPEVQMEFSDVEAEILGTKIYFEYFRLNFVETQTPQTLSRALCIWTERTNKGVSNNGIVNYINFLLKGDEDEQKSDLPKSF